MKNELSVELKRISSVGNGADIHLIFFRLVQVICLLSILYFLLITMPFILSAGELYGLGASLPAAWFVIPVLIGGLQILLAEFSLRAIRQDRFVGTVFGLLLSVLMLPSWSFALGIFGLYCFLNPAYQRRHLSDSPLPFKRLLAAMNIDRTGGLAGD